MHSIAMNSRTAVLYCVSLSLRGPRLVKEKPHTEIGMVLVVNTGTTPYALTTPYLGTWNLQHQHSPTPCAHQAHTKPTVNILYSRDKRSMY
jgi:hypothetical protein